MANKRYGRGPALGHPIVLVNRFEEDNNAWALYHAQQMARGIEIRWLIGEVSEEVHWRTRLEW
jgi:hypothetical protein